MRPASYVPGELIPLPLSGSIPELPHVAKVENRATPKISRKLIFRRSAAASLCSADYEGPWSFLCETMWSLTSPRAKRISGSKKFSFVTPKGLFQHYLPGTDIGDAFEFTRQALEIQGR